MAASYLGYYAEKLQYCSTSELQALCEQHGVATDTSDAAMIQNLTALQNAINGYCEHRAKLAKAAERQAKKTLKKLLARDVASVKTEDLRPVITELLLGYIDSDSEYCSNAIEALKTVGVSVSCGGMCSDWKALERFDEYLQCDICGEILGEVGEDEDVPCITFQSGCGSPPSKKGLPKDMDSLLKKLCLFAYKVVNQ
eukprot:m.203402 g.203402  ORF g.203402 m.203402 type:complete len:198 (-) comp14991_c0_seq2:177-770(-)